VAVTAGGRIVRPVFDDRALIEMRALWSRELNDTDPTLTASLADDSSDTRFSVAGVPIFPDTFTLGASISGQSANAFSSTPITKRSSGAADGTSIRSLLGFRTSGSRRLRTGGAGSGRRRDHRP
jgi:hypothetical protein